MINVDFSGLRPGDTDRPPVLEPGRYVFEVTEMVHSSERTPCVEVRCIVIGGPSCIGQRHTERFYLSEAAKKRFAIFLKRMGVIEDADLGKVVSIDSEALTGELVVADVVRETFEGRDGPSVSAKWGYASFWRRGSEPPPARGANPRERVPEPAHAATDARDYEDEDGGTIPF